MQIISMLIGMISHRIVQRNNIPAGHSRLLQIYGEIPDRTELFYGNLDRIAGNPFPVYTGAGIQGLDSGFIVVLFFKDPLAVFIKLYVAIHMLLQVFIPVRPEDIPVKVLEKCRAWCGNGYSEILMNQYFILADFKRDPILVSVCHKNVVVLVIVFIPDTVDPNLQFDRISRNNPVARNRKFQNPVPGIVRSLVFVFVIPVQVEPPSHIAGMIRIRHVQHKRFACRGADRNILSTLIDLAIRRSKSDFDNL